MKIVSFGDSFVFGSELANNIKGQAAWPGRAAKKLGIEYHTMAVPGCGNDHVAQQIYTWFSQNPVEDTLAVINWTWMCRWDFYIVEHQTWITLGPTCVPDKLKHLVDMTEAQDLVDFYHRRINSSLLWNKTRNLQTICAAQNFLKQKGIKAVQTHMDYEMFDQKYHAPEHVVQLQNMVTTDLELFEGKNFVDWSHGRGYPVTIQANHPLEEAHEAASELWLKKYAGLLKI